MAESASEWPDELLRESRPSFRVGGGGRGARGGSSLRSTYPPLRAFGEFDEFSTYQGGGDGSGASSSRGIEHEKETPKQYKERKLREAREKQERHRKKLEKSRKYAQKIGVLGPYHMTFKQLEKAISEKKLENEKRLLETPGRDVLWNFRKSMSHSDVEREEERERVWESLRSLREEAESLGVSGTYSMTSKEEIEEAIDKKTKSDRLIREERRGRDLALVARGADRKPGDRVSYKDRRAEREAFVRLGGYDHGLCHHSDHTDEMIAGHRSASDIIEEARKRKSSESLRGFV